MKTRLFLTFLLISSCALISIACGKGSNEWLVRINGDEITKTEFDQLYYAHHKQFFQQVLGLMNISNQDVDKFASDPGTVRRLPTLNKQIFLQEIVNQRLLFNKAVSEGYDDKEELRALLKVAKETAVVQFYIREKFKDDIAVTDSEVETFYNENRAKFKAEPIDTAEKKIRQFLSTEKLRKKMAMFVGNLRETSRIERNESAESHLHPRMPEAQPEQPAQDQKTTQPATGQ